MVGWFGKMLVQLLMNVVQVICRGSENAKSGERWRDFRDLLTSPWRGRVARIDDGNGICCLQPLVIFTHTYGVWKFSSKKAFHFLCVNNKEHTKLQIRYIYFQNSSVHLISNDDISIFYVPELKWTIAKPQEIFFAHILRLRLSTVEHPGAMK